MNGTRKELFKQIEKTVYCYTTKYLGRIIRLEENGRIEVGKGRTRTDDVWKKNGKFGKTLGCKKQEERNTKKSTRIINVTGKEEYGRV